MLGDASLEQGMIESLWQYVGQVVVLGGGGVAVGFALFKFLGEKWLDGKFAERLQTLKAAQDEQLRHVQSFIEDRKSVV